jgi:anti-anti-sigma factor
MPGDTVAPSEFLPVTTSRRRRLAFVRRDPARTVVWVRGEQDHSTVAALSETMARAIALDDADLVVDLSEVTFMGTAACGVIVRARELLRLRSRSLSLRSPSRCARRILDLCGHADLLDPRPVRATPMAGTTGALGSWVAVLAADRIDRHADASALQPSSAPGPVPVARVVAARVSSADAHHRADAPTTNVAGRGGP